MTRHPRFLLGSPRRPAAGLSRRGFLRAAATVGAAGLTGLARAEDFVKLPLEVPIWTRTQGLYAPLRGYPATQIVNGFPGGLSPEIPTATPGPDDRMLDLGRLIPAYLSPIQHQQGPLTDSSVFYVVAHGRVPVIDLDRHYLVVHGERVATPKLFTMKDLMSFPPKTARHFMECAGNSFNAYFQAPGKAYAQTTAQSIHGLLSATEWTGVPVREVLKAVGLRWKPGDGERLWVLAEGADGAVLDRSIPIEKLWDDALLAYSQRGELLRREQGYPLRLVLPGWEGNANVKWLRRLKVGASPFFSREETTDYADFVLLSSKDEHQPSEKPKFTKPGVGWQFTFVMEVKSVITFPSTGFTLQPPPPGGTTPVTVRGFAWSGRGKVTRVEVRVGDGPWQAVPPPPPGEVEPMMLTPFTFNWQWDGRATTISSRAFDEAGMEQPDFQTLITERGGSYFYHYNGIQTWAVAANGEVTNHAESTT